MSILTDQYGEIRAFWVALFIAACFAVSIALLLCVKFQLAEDNVSGVVYNTRNNALLSGNTYFSIRAAVDTVVTEENQSSYCLPEGSPYKELVNRAARDKNIKVQITTQKGVWIAAPWACIANVTVEEVK